MITLQQLKYFRDVAKNGHLTQTAEKLYITQTTLSNTIITLERQLGVKLFDRVGRSLQLSEIGALYFKYVNEALLLLDNAQSAVDDYKANAQLAVSVAMTNSTIWADLIQGYRTMFPDYNIRQIGCERTAFRDMLMNQEIDFVIAGIEDLNLTGLEYHILRDETLYLCVSHGHPLSQRESIYMAEAKDESFISLPPSNGFRLFCDNLFRKLGIECNVAIECDYTLRGKLVEAGFGVAVTTHTSFSQNMLGTNIAYIPIADDCAQRPIAIIWNPNHYLSRAAVDFREYVFRTVQ